MLLFQNDIFVIQRNVNSFFITIFLVNKNKYIIERKLNEKYSHPAIFFYCWYLYIIYYQCEKNSQLFCYKILFTSYLKNIIKNLFNHFLFKGHNFLNSSTHVNLGNNLAGRKPRKERLPSRKKTSVILLTKLDVFFELILTNN